MDEHRADIPVSKLPQANTERKGTSPLQYLILFLVGSSLLLGWWLALQYGAFSRDSAIGTSKEEVEENLAVAQADLQYTPYVNSEIGVAFEYPSSWGKIVAEEELGTCANTSPLAPCKKIFLLFEDTPASIFLATASRDFETYLGRGGFWGDLAADADYTESLCVEQDPTDCTVYVTNNGMVVKRDTVNEYGSDITIYAISSPSSVYPSIILSPSRVIGRDLEGTVLNTLKFLDASEVPADSPSYSLTYKQDKNWVDSTVKRLTVTFQYTSEPRCDSTDIQQKFSLDAGDGTIYPADCHGVLDHQYPVGGEYVARYLRDGVEVDQALVVIVDQ